MTAPLRVGHLFLTERSSRSLRFQTGGPSQASSSVAFEGANTQFANSGRDTTGKCQWQTLMNIQSTK
jgi:hypothetical protein